MTKTFSKDAVEKAAEFARIIQKRAKSPTGNKLSKINDIIDDFMVFEVNGNKLSTCGVRGYYEITKKRARFVEMDG